MIAAELKLKSPYVSLFQRGNFFSDASSPLWQRGERGDFWAEMEAEII